MKISQIIRFMTFIVLMYSCAGLPLRELPKANGNCAPFKKIEVFTLAKSALSWDGALLPAYPSKTPEITILRIIIPAGVTLAKHQHPVINAGVLLKGELTVQTDQGKTLRLKAGQALVEVVNTWHSGKNEGTKPAEIIVFYAGSQDNPITIYENM
jgi:quercetin dioxygenase-like cupin family protein